jgi:tRNA(fMet)-specific endonuclease VapC
MTGNKCLVDTSIIIHAFRNNNAVTRRLNELKEVFVPATVVGELFYGAYNSTNVSAKILQVQSFLADCTVLPSDTTTSEIYGQIKAALIKKGKPLPENDIWIAATALQYSLPLFATDKHFTEIDGIILL